MFDALESWAPRFRTFCALHLQKSLVAPFFKIKAGFTADDEKPSKKLKQKRVNELKGSMKPAGKGDKDLPESKAKKEKAKKAKQAKQAAKKEEKKKRKQALKATRTGFRVHAIYIWLRPFSTRYRRADLQPLSVLSIFKKEGSICNLLLG